MSDSVAWLGLLYALGPTSVLFGKHIDKLDQDRRKGVRTLPVLLGEAKARAVARALIVSPYLLVGLAFAKGALGWPVACRGRRRADRDPARAHRGDRPHRRARR